MQSGIAVPFEPGDLLQAIDGLALAVARAGMAGQPRASQQRTVFASPHFTGIAG